MNHAPMIGACNGYFCKKHIVASLVVAVGLLLGGCGGGSSSSPAATATINGKAIDGYIRDALACIDINYNGNCDSDEPNATTDSGGNFSIVTSPANAGNYPIIVYADSNSYDMDRGTYFTNPLKLTAPVGVTTITPITTIIKAKIDEKKTKEQAESETATLLAIASGKLYIDYIAEGDSTLTALAYKIATALQNSNNNYLEAIEELQKQDPIPTPDPTLDPVTPTITASNFTYSAPIGNSAKTFDWKVESNASSSDNSTLNATVKSQGSKGVATISGDNITYTPSSDKNGTDAFIITVSNSSNQTKDITITVEDIDTQTPTITSTTPEANATNVAINSAVSVTFSKEMNASSVDTSTGSLKDSAGNAIAGSVASSSNTFTFTPSSDLSYSSTYTATLTTAMKDINGNALANDYSWSFTTGTAPDTTPPTLDSTTPADNATGVQVDSYITLVFSEAIKPSSATSSSIVLKDSSDNTITTTISFIDTKTIKVTPNANLNTLTVYTLTITTGITDDANNPLASNQTLSFTTVNSTPSANDFTYGTAIGGSAKTFNWKSESNASDSDGHTLSATVKTQGSKGTSSINGDNITYTPSANKEGSDSIVITIADTLGGAKDITITVTGIDTMPPTISATYPSANATDVGVYTWIDINFSEPMDSTTLTTANITLSGGNSDKSCQDVEYIGGDGNTTRCYPYVTTASHKLDDSTAYTLTVTTNVKDSNGNAMANTNNTVAFTTGVENKLPRLRTGQSAIYATNDDGDYVASGLGIARSFTRPYDAVTDTVTGLEWEDGNIVATTTRTWTDANNYCNDLTIPYNGDLSDWRLPTIEELATIADKGSSNPSSFTGFQHTASSFYWSSSTYAPSTDNAWYVHFGYGLDGVSLKTNNYYVRCVRAGVSPAPTYIRDSSKEVVLDTSSGLMWQDDSTAKTTTKTWTDAIDYCETQIGSGGTFAGYADWRLPNYNELYQLADRNRSNPAISQEFQNYISSNYWSSSTFDPDTDIAWYVHFGYGKDDGDYKTNSLHVRCVRGGK